MSTRCLTVLSGLVLTSSHPQKENDTSQVVEEEEVLVRSAKSLEILREEVTKEVSRQISFFNKSCDARNFIVIELVFF